MLERQGKVWGTTALVYSSRYVEVHLLEITKGGYCSEHLHARKLNKFVVLKGKLEISTWTDFLDSTVLGPGQTTAINVGVWHRFHALEDTVCLEIYETAEIGEDIERRTRGGIE